MRKAEIASGPSSVVETVAVIPTQITIFKFAATRFESVFICVSVSWLKTWTCFFFCFFYLYIVENDILLGSKGRS